MNHFPANIKNNWPWVMQGAGTLIAMFALAVAPPAQGQMMLVPIGGSADGIARLAIERGAAIVAPGGPRGSLIVSGDRAKLTATMLAHGILVLAAAPALCGSAARS